MLRYKYTAQAALLSRVDTKSTGRYKPNTTTGKAVRSNRLICAGRFRVSPVRQPRHITLVDSLPRTWQADNPSSPVLPHANKLAISVTLEVPLVCDSFRMTLQYAHVHVHTDLMGNFKTQYEGDVTKECLPVGHSL
jgi:hypothetical protein